MSTLEQVPRPAKAILQFLPGWTELVSGQLRAGSHVLIEYDPTRLVDAPLTGEAPLPSEVVIHVRVHPGEREVSASLLQRSGEGPGRLERPDPWVHELQIPPDATQIELWFHVTDAEGWTRWDTRYGANYRFGVVPALDPSPIPPKSVAYRWGAGPRLDLVHVVSEHVAKHRSAASPQALGIETRLFIQAWTESDLPPPRSAWVDIHVFDEANQLVHSETLPLQPAGPAESGGLFFVLDRPIHESSSLAAPGSVARAKSEAVRKLQYRLYYQVNGQTFTDGLLHQHDLPPDAFTNT